MHIKSKLIRIDYCIEEGSIHFNENPNIRYIEFPVVNIIKLVYRYNDGSSRVELYESLSEEVCNFKKINWKRILKDRNEEYLGLLDPVYINVGIHSFKLAKITFFNPIETLDV